MKPFTQFVNEARNEDPTYEEMVNHLKNTPLKPDGFAIDVAIHFYAQANYEGMRSNLYSALSRLSQKNLKVRGSLASQGTLIEILVDYLVDEFGGSRP